MKDLRFASAGEQISALRKHRIGPVELLRETLAHVRRGNPEINAVVEINEEQALRVAKAIEKRRGTLGPLAGLPVTIKDSYEVQGFHAVCGDPALKNHRPERNAEAVQRMIDAGCVIYGKTNAPKMAMDFQTYNSVYGVTNNPHDPQRAVGGSSGGSAASLASGFSSLEIGSDIGGSLRNPAHYCGVCSHKPSYGLISLRGHIPGPPGTMSQPDLAVAGPMARYAEDLKLLFSVLTTPSESPAKRGRVLLPPHPALSRDWRKLRVALWMDDSFCPIDSEVREPILRFVEDLRRLGLKVQPAAPENLSTLYNLYIQLLMGAVSAGIPATQLKLMKATAGFLRVLSTFGLARELSRFVRGATQSHSDWVILNEIRERMRYSFDDFFRKFDVILSPVTPVRAFRHQTGGTIFSRRLRVNGRDAPYLDHFKWIAAATALYLPVTTIPIARDGGLPSGVQITGPYLGDATTLEFAYQVERALGGFVPPRMFVT